MIAKLNKTQVKLMRKLKKSTAKPGDAAPTLESVHIESGKSIATNGRLLTIIADPMGLDDGNYTIDTPGKLTEISPSLHEYPNWQRIEPNGQAEMTITLDAALLRDALEYLDNDAVISVRSAELVGITGTIDGVSVKMAVIAKIKR